MKKMCSTVWNCVLAAAGFYKEDSKEYVDRMQSDGYEIYYPECDELFIDIDSNAAYSLFLMRFSRLVQEYPEAKVIYNQLSKSGEPRRHIIVKMPFSLDIYTRIFCQAALGSDLVREKLSLFRADKGDKYPTLFADKEMPNGR